MGFHCLDFNANKYEVWLMIHISHMIYISCSRMPDPISSSGHCKNILDYIQLLPYQIICCASYTFLTINKLLATKVVSFLEHITCKRGCNLGSRSSSGWSWLASGTRRSIARPWTRPRPSGLSTVPAFPWRPQGFQQWQPTRSAEQPRVPSWLWAQRCSSYTAPRVTSTWTGISCLASQFTVQTALRILCQVMFSVSFTSPWADPW